jgi:peptidoglycan/xylan/chitin deacetylase (PgdA/CDA1 family)
MPASDSNVPWLAQLRPRLAAHLWIKSLGIPLFFWVFFVVYFHLLRNPQRPVTTMPLTWLDHWMHFHPAALLPYVSLWIYVLLPPSLLRGRREVLTYVIAVGFVTLGGLAVFRFWPTATPTIDQDWNRFSSFAFLKSVDASGNAFPSLHVAFAVFSGVWTARLLRRVNAPAVFNFTNMVWCVAIVYSTLATGQHVLVDALAGIALGAAGALLDPMMLRGPAHQQGGWLNRQMLAFTVSIFAKLTLFALNFPETHPLAAVLLFLIPDLWIFSGLLIPNVPALVPTVTRFATTRPEVWLTIDDGPSPQTTRAMLDLLAQHHARATFFVIGERVSAHSELVKAIADAGHTLGNHTYSHPLATFWLAGPWRTAREIDQCSQTLSTAVGRTTTHFRAPAGIKTFFLRGALARRNFALIGWTARGREHGCSTITAPLRRLVTAIRPGAILLVHESITVGPHRLALLEALLQQISAKGYRCVIPSDDQLIS